MTINELRKIRLKKLEGIKKAGILPFSARTKRTHSINDTFKSFTELSRLKKSGFKWQN